MAGSSGAGRPEVRVAVALLASLLALGSAPAVAQQRIAPADDSAVDQFLTAVPGPAGDERLPRGPEEEARGVLSPSERRRLERLGPAGRSAVASFLRTAPGNSGRPVTALERGAEGGFESRSRAIGAALGGRGDGGLGLGLPGILLLVLAVATVGAVAHRRAPRPRG